MLRLRCLLATLVGLTTVPYLARRVVAARLREAMDYEVTRAGMIYILITVVIGIAAINTGNNLLYVIVSALLAAIIVSGVASAIVLRSLELDVLLPEHVFAARPMMARLVAPQRQFVDAFFLGARCSGQAQSRCAAGDGKPTRFGWPRNRAPEKQWLRLPDRRLRRVNRTTGKADSRDSPSIFPSSRPGRNYVPISNCAFRSVDVMRRRTLAWLRAFRLPF